MARLMFTLTLGALTAAILTGCSLSNDVRASTGAIFLFHKHLDAGAFDDVYDEAASALRAVVPRKTFVSFLSTAHEKLGGFRSGVRHHWRENYSLGLHTMIVTYKATYQRAPAYETFSFVFENGDMLLAGYHVSSPGVLPA